MNEFDSEIFIKNSKNESPMSIAEQIINEGLWMQMIKLLKKETTEIKYDPKIALTNYYWA